MSVTVTPADRAAAHDKIAAANLGRALELATRYIDTEDQAQEVRDAAWTIRLLLLGATTDSRLGSAAARQRARVGLRDLLHADEYGRPVAAVFRRTMNALDGKVE
jgi:hypothetical protein